MDRTYKLESAAVIIPNRVARDLWIDFRILQQVAKFTDNKASSLPKKALKACNDIVSAFKREPEDEKDPKILEGMLQRCREIAWEILGPLDPKSLQKLIPHNTKGGVKDANIWAIGHWSVS